jgi:ABC-type Na+ efflux pump permease subunit
LRKVLIVTKKELKEVLQQKEIIFTLIFLPFIFAIVMPMSIPLINLIINNAFTGEDNFHNFPAIVPYWNSLQPKQQFLVFYSMIYFIMFLLTPMILPMAIAGDTIAGERERKTIESLLATPIKTNELLLGKLLTTLIPTIIITWFSGLIFMIITDLVLYQEISRLFFPNIYSTILLFGFSPFLALITTQTMIVVSSKATGTREAQQIGSIVIIPLFGFILSEAALLIFVKPIWSLISGCVLLLVTIILFIINNRLFDREAMIATLER